MSRVDDSDNQRIKEMQEQELRTRMDRDKKDTETRVAKSFQQVMAERGQKQTSKQQSSMHNARENAQAKEGEKNALQQLLQRTPKESPELHRRAALANAMSSGLAKKRQLDGQESKRAENERTEDLTRKVDDEKEMIDRDVRDADDAELRRAEEREAEMRKINADPEGKGEHRAEERQNRRGGGGGGGDDGERAQGVQAAEARPAQGSSAPQISREIVERIVNAIQAAYTADGRTEMHIDLKGTMLDGVRLEVHAKDGKVSCVFRGCSRDTKALLESSKGALMRGLSKKGMSLVSMKIA